MADFDLEKEIDKAEKRARSSTYLEAKTEFAQQAYPLIAALYAEFNERVNDVEDAVSELIEQNGSYLQPDMSTQLLTTFEMTKIFIGEVSKLPLDDVNKHKLAQMSEALLASVELSVQAVSEISSDETDEDEGDEEEAEDAETETAEDDEGTE